MTYSISGTDAGSFSVDSSTGVVTFSAAPDYENPTDSDTNNSYIFTATASDGTNDTTQNVTINVTDVDDGVEVTGVDGYIKDANVTDALGQVASYNGSNGKYTFADSPRYPLTLTGGRLIDTNASFDINMTAQSGSVVISPITTFLGNDSVLLDRFSSLGLNKFTLEDFSIDYVATSDMNLSKLSQLCYLILKNDNLTNTFKQSLENNNSISSLNELFTLAEHDINNTNEFTFKQKYFAKKYIDILRIYDGVDTNSTLMYNNFFTNTILTQDDINNSIGSIEKILKDTKLSLNNDFSLQETISYYAARIKTGQTVTYKDGDDGNTSRGLERSYSRDDINNIVTDNTTKLMWQDNNDTITITKNWSESKEYCKNLTLGGSNKWRLPTRDELRTILDYGNWDFVINPIFENKNAEGYWTDTQYDVSSALRIKFELNVFGEAKVRKSDITYLYYIRCVTNPTEGE